ncbi:MAG: undecaprenyl-phosphate galactose phosphotransferase WbaP [Rubricoccaceae bacterium]|nr:undecaprenyl-phosphate galactose phosphotransferase WbaP [Rubricoccaceae bacterium]
MSSGTGVGAEAVLVGGPRRYRRRFAVLFMADVLALSLCMTLAGLGYDLLFWIGPLFVRGLIGGVALAIGLFAASGLYSVFPMPPVKEVRAIAVVLGVAAAFLAVAALTTVPTPSAAIPVLVTLGVGFGLAAFAVPTARLTARALCAAKPWWGCQAVVLGHSEAGRDLIRTLREQPELGLAPAVLLEDTPAEPGEEVEGVPVAGPLAVASRYATERRVPYAIVAMPEAGRERIIEVVDRYTRHFERVLVIPNLRGLTSLWVQARDLDGTLGLEIRHRLLVRWRQRLKRAVDLMIVLAAAPVVLTAGLLIAALIRLDSPGPVLFRQERLGRGGRCFTLFKFRSMHVGADALLRDLLAQDEAAREEYARYAKLQDDPRVTRVGRWIRKTSLDELPQLLNVLLGEMSLVGPRAYLPAELERMQGRERTILRVRPGVTGLWQVSGRNRISFEGRLDLDIRYIRDWSVSLDLYLLARTVPVVLTGHGAA